MINLGTRLLLLLPEQSVERDVGDLDDLEANSGNISQSVTRATESRDENLVVLVDEVQATVAGDESSDLLSVLDELNTNCLTNGRVGLLSLNSNLLEHDALSLRDTSHRQVELLAAVRLGVVLVGPSLLAAQSAQLAPSSHTLSLTHFKLSREAQATLVSRFGFAAINVGTFEMWETNPRIYEVLRTVPFLIRTLLSKQRRQRLEPTLRALSDECICKDAAVETLKIPSIENKSNVTS